MEVLLVQAAKKNKLLLIPHPQQRGGMFTQEQS